MNLQTNLKGRLRNTSLPKSHGLMPVFEAVVNSIQSIEEKKNIDSGEITLSIIRSTQESISIKEKALPSITGFIVKDNGVGFNDRNYESFKTLDSEYKVDKGCRGVGRLIWLKAFEAVEVESFFNENKINKKRSFCFNSKLGIHKSNTESVNTSESGTIVKLLGFEDKYRKSVPVQVNSIAKLLLEHILWYFVHNEKPSKVIVEDGNDTIDLNVLYDYLISNNIYCESVKIKNVSFNLIHMKLYSSVNKAHNLAWCAASRLVKEEPIQGKIPGLYKKIEDQLGDFTYTCYVSSEYLDDNVRSERTSFDISENPDEFFDEISFTEIRNLVFKCTEEYLKDALIKSIAKGRKRIDDFIDNHAPRYRPIAHYFFDELLVIDPDKSDKELELQLHSLWYGVERELINDGANIMQPRHKEHIEEYKLRLSDYLEKAESIKKSDLANYVSHRKVIIDILEKSIEKLDDGKYAREDMIHELIMPMRKDSSEVFLDSCNLWLVDERLAFHNYLASDKTLNSMPITGEQSNKEPDLVNLRVFDNPLLVNDKITLPLAAITIIEIKRPMRNDMKEGEDKDPIDQALSYLERIRDGRVTTKSGRPIPRNNNIPGYCYVICDLTESMRRRCRRANLRITSDGMGFFGYNEPSHAYIEVISFDQLVAAAKERNRAFFDKLGLPVS